MATQQDHQRNEGQRGIIEVTWHEADIRGYTDLLPADIFAAERSGSELLHEVRSPRGSTEQAKCVVTVAGNEARLDYAAFAEFNAKRKMIPGELLLVFADVARTMVKDVFWREPGGASRPADATVSYVTDIARLRLVSSSREIQESVAEFNRGAASDQGLTGELLHQTTYWVLDPVTACFGPSKFVGFMGMTFESYRRARRGHWTGDRFDGNITRKRIEHVLGHGYASDEGLADRLESWASQLTGAPDVFQGIDRGKWKFVTLPVLHNDAVLPEEITSPERFPEGASRKVSVNAYERSQEARDACIRHYGCTCVVCGFDFSQRYGDLGEGFIVVHHLKRLADIGTEYEVDPIIDLRPVCPNCHAMIHRQEPPIEFAELKKQVRN